MLFQIVMGTQMYMAIAQLLERNMAQIYELVLHFRIIAANILGFHNQNNYVFGSLDHTLDSSVHGNNSRSHSQVYILEVGTQVFAFGKFVLHTLDRR